MSGSRATIGERLGTGFLLVFAVMVALVVAIGWRMSQNDSSSLVVEAAIARTQRIDELERSVLVLAANTRDALLTRGPAELQGFAASAVRLDEALRTFQRAESNTGSAAQVEALGGLVSQYVAAARRAVADGTPETSALRELRSAILANVQQLLRQHDATVQAALQQMDSNRHAAAGTLEAGVAITFVLLAVIGVLTTRSVRRPAGELVAVASALRAGDWQSALQLRQPPGPPSARRFEMAQIADALGAAAAALESREQRLVAHAEIARASGASLDHSQLAQASLGAVLQHVGAEVGVIYGREACSDRLVPVAAHAAGTALAPVGAGEGIVGQCALDRKPLVVRDIPRDSAFLVKLGYDEAPPRTVVAVPILFRNDVVGVLLVAALGELGADVPGFLSAAAAQIGVGLANARAYQEVQELFAKVSAQGEQIQAQNEELQAQAEEIQAQNEQLQVQSEEIQAQNEELQAQNEDLQRQAAHLHDQAGALRGADERKNHFLGVLAHELRNPLAPISSCVELLNRNGSDPAVFAHTQQVLARQVRHMTRLVDDLLEVTRISRGKITLKRERLNVTDLVEECVADQRAAFEQHGMVLAVELPEVPIHVEGDHTRLCQVFLNLLTNAVKFCQPGTRIAVTATLDAPSREVAIHVADDSIGIDPDFLGRIFEPFTQADSELARTKGGLGLGLALSKGLVELHGGRIEARSEGPGRGAEFVVTLPLAEAQGRAAEPPAEPRVRQPDRAAMPRVLIVDDNADAADSLAQLLSFEGCQVEVAYAAQPALDAARRFRPQVVLCDVGLPGMDGYEFARAARRDPLLRSSTLIALTGYGSASDQLRASEAGFDVHMAKPTDFATLLAALRAPPARTDAE